jgi:hypothetical protein
MDLLAFFSGVIFMYLIAGIIISHSICRYATRHGEPDSAFGTLVILLAWPVVMLMTGERH